MLHLTAGVRCSGDCDRHRGAAASVDEWLVPVPHAFPAATQGAVSKALFAGFLPVFVKQYRSESVFRRETRIAGLVSSIPFFAEYLCSWTRERDGVMFSMSRFVDGSFTLASVLPSVGVRMFTETCLQLCCALELAQDRFRFGHNDLHCCNVLVRPGSETSVQLDQYKVTWKRPKYLVTIVDYGMSTCVTPDGDVVEAPAGYDEFGIKKRLQPGADMFMFLNFVRNEPGVKKSVRRLVDSWLLGFYWQSRTANHVAELGAGDRPASVRTPKAFFEFILRHSKHLARVEVTHADRVTRPHLLDDPASFLDSHFNGSTRGREERDAQFFERSLRSATVSCAAVQRLFAVRQLRLTSPLYTEWASAFQDSIQFNKYWKNKLTVDEIVRYDSWAK